MLFDFKRLPFGIFEFMIQLIKKFTCLFPAVLTGLCLTATNVYAVGGGVIVTTGSSSNTSPNTSWYKKPTKTEIDWLLTLSAQTKDDDTFYDLGIGYPIYGELNQLNSLSLIFINRITSGDIADDYFDDGDASSSDYFALESALRLHLPVTNEFSLFAEAGIDSGRLLFVELIDIGVSSSKNRHDDDYHVDYNGAIGVGYSRANFGINIFTRYRKLHPGYYDYEQTFFGIEFVAGF